MKSHPFDAISFVSGAIVLAIGVFILAGDGTPQIGTWLGPLGIIGLGALLLVLGWQSTRNREDAPADEA